MSFPTFDTAQTGKPVTATGQVFDFGAPTDFYFTLGSYLVTGQATGPTTIFQLLGGKDSGKFVSVAYGEVTPPQSFNATTVVCTAINGTGSVSVRVIISSGPQSITPQSVGVVTSSGSTPGTLTGTVAKSTNLTVYTAPAANYKVRIVRMVLQGVSGQAFVVSISNPALSAEVESLASTTFPANNLWFIGYNSTDNTILYGEMLLLPGEQIGISNGSSVDAITYLIDVLLEPL